MSNGWPLNDGSTWRRALGLPPGKTHGRWGRGPVPIPKRANGAMTPEQVARLHSEPPRSTEPDNANRLYERSAKAGCALVIGALVIMFAAGFIIGRAVG